MEIPPCFLCVSVEGTLCRYLCIISIIFRICEQLHSENVNSYILTTSNVGFEQGSLYQSTLYRGTTVCILIFYITLFVLLFRYYSSCITLSELSELSNVLCAYFICSKQYVVVVLAVTLLEVTLRVVLCTCILCSLKRNEIMYQ